MEKIIIAVLIILLYFYIKYGVTKNKNLQKLPKDIIERIDIDFPDLEEKKFVKQELTKLANSILNVGSDQLSRSILFLSKGSIQDFKRILEFDDPRDVLVEAENANGNPGHFFTIPFTTD